MSAITCKPEFFAAGQKQLWHSEEPAIWAPVGGNHIEDPARSVMKTLWDQPRWLEAFHLYDERGSELFEQICELPEYYLTRTENSILERDAEKIIAAAPVECIVELGAGFSKKTVHLLTAQTLQRSRTIFAPIDVSISGLQASRDAVAREFPAVEFHGLHSRYETGFGSIDRALPTLFVFLGSTIGNFNPPAFVHFFSELADAMGPNDFLLLGADRVKDVNTLEPAYADAKGLTAEFILNVFLNINRLTGSNFDASKMRYHSWFNPEWSQIEMYAVANAAQEIHFPSYGSAFHWHKNERILVEISRKFDPLRLQEQFRYFGLHSVGHFTDAKEWFSLLLFKKSI
ncbi:MAG: L-histidine N(alpha)-methyltransferase [Deltaproteobacteria bacterium]|nr:L-histidine N(alpha)-methyltransferase [Deltaproteobacteria bacterium]MBM4299307.1 L-histidine N(alpha)-methyltransferase [Deltaproteobacteria bacterium]